MNVFELFARLSLDTSEYERDLDDAQTKADGFGSKLKAGLATAAKIGAAAIGAVATGVAALGKASLSQYAEYEQLVGGAQLMPLKIGNWNAHIFYIIAWNSVNKWDFNSIIVIILQIALFPNLFMFAIFQIWQVFSSRCLPANSLVFSSCLYLSAVSKACYIREL